MSLLFLLFYHSWEVTFTSLSLEINRSSSNTFAKKFCVIRDMGAGVYQAGKVTLY